MNRHLEFPMSSATQYVNISVQSDEKILCYANLPIATIVDKGLTNCGKDAWIEMKDASDLGELADVRKTKAPPSSRSFLANSINSALDSLNDLDTGFDELQCDYQIRLHLTCNSDDLDQEAVSSQRFIAATDGRWSFKPTRS